MAMKRTEFHELLEQKVLVCDGAMGTRIYDFGIGFEHSFDELSISRPEIIRSIHQEYIDAGADVILTNSFGANRIRLLHWGLEDRAVEFAQAAAMLAREAVDASERDVLVAGSIGPLGAPLAPVGRIRPKEAFDAFSESAGALIAGGAGLRPPCRCQGEGCHTEKAQLHPAAAHVDPATPRREDNALVRGAPQV